MVLLSVPSHRDRSLLFQSRRGRGCPATASVLCSLSILSGFVNLDWAVDGVLDAFPDEGEAALESDFFLSNRGMDGIINDIEEPYDLVDAKQCISVENERDNGLTEGESLAFKGSVARVDEDIAAVRTPDSRIAVPGLDGGFVAFRTRSLLPILFTAPLDFIVERLWAQHY